jgi:peptidoglycan/LPS O-acetylase OafA/YrhL
MPKKTYANLEMLRAICALVVFANHLYMHTTGFPRIGALQMLTNFATEAVICFFVLSGCVIALQ